MLAIPQYPFSNRLHAVWRICCLLFQVIVFSVCYFVLIHLKKIVSVQSSSKKKLYKFFFKSGIDKSDKSPQYQHVIAVHAFKGLHKGWK